MNIKWQQYNNCYINKNLVVKKRLYTEKKNNIRLNMIK